LDATPPKTTIEWAAGIAAYYSKAKGAGRAIVSYTRKKYVRPIKGAPPGLVRIRNESTVRVAPFKPDEA
jgi:predicted ribosome quality control (RQC) complex YloA/Tae2 family protein